MFRLLKQVNWRDHILTLAQLGLSVVLLVGAVWFYFDKQTLLATQQQAYESAQFAADESENYEFLLQENLEDYRRLVESGYIGTPRRLQWLETLRSLGNNYEIPGIDFTLESSQITEQGVDPFWHNEVKVRSTDMNMVLQLSHEGELYRLFSGLRDQAAGVFSVERCRLRWLDAYSEELALTRFRGDCQLKWYTLIDGTGAVDSESL